MGKKRQIAKDSKTGKKSVELQLSSTPSEKNNGLSSLCDFSDKKSTDTNLLNFFTEPFTGKIKAFENFYAEYLGVKTKNREDLNFSFEMIKLNENISSTIETSCIEILKVEILEAERDIQRKKQQIEEEIKNLRTTKQEISEILYNQGSFSEKEVQYQLQIFERKEKEKTGILEGYQYLLKKAKVVYNRQSGLKMQIQAE